MLKKGQLLYFLELLIGKKTQINVNLSYEIDVLFCFALPIIAGENFARCIPNFELREEKMYSNYRIE